MTLLTDLPLEVIGDIVSYLASYDQVSVLCVCKSWNNIFRSLLYRNVTVHSRAKLRRLLKFLEKHHHSNATGNIVRSLKLDVPDLTGDEVRRLRVACPKVESLSVNFGSSFEDIMAWCTAQGTELTQLNLSAANNQVGFHRILDVLPSINRLRSLTLGNIDSQYVMNLHRMDSIHTACPRLETLILGISQTERSTRPPPIEDIDPQVEPIQTLRKITLDFGNAFYHYPQWFHYFGLRYPNLESCRFERGFHKWPGRSSTAAEAYRTFAKNCQQLRSIRWVSVTSLDPLLFEALAEFNTTLEEIDLYEDRKSDLYENFKIYDGLLASPLAQKISRLFIGPRPECSHPSEFLDDIGRFRGLRKLKIVDSRNEVIPFDMNDILACCPNVTQLTLDNIQLTAERTSNPKPHCLVSLEIVNADLNTSVFECISSQCPRLDKLRLDRCTYPTSSLKVYIPMQHQSFDKFDLVCDKRAGMGTVRFFALTVHIENDHETVHEVEFDPTLTKWYYSTDIHTTFDDTGFATRFLPLSTDDVFTIKVIVSQSRDQANKASLKELCRRQDRESRSQLKFRNLVSGYVHIHCQSVNHLYINKKSTC
ncbi:hypothetical protein EC973_005467 [Apophysomyces ossiformis]|uniref:F-box domain-containing protein n=1 Tax=Apophysomyces ossiformis TaxID=679940 RepID=A0A8H7BX39_9FUNG|nr:hypothetical protein EC973_005467 [Apophysomyces ossiformis]